MDSANRNLLLMTAATQDLQLYAADCLDRYCQSKNICHPAIGELLSHLRSMGECESLAGWERNGACLALNGRGDDLPQDLHQSLTPEAADTLEKLVGYVVEVGLADMYGAASGLPLAFLKRVMSILEEGATGVPEFSSPSSPRQVMK